MNMNKLKTLNIEELKEKMINAKSKEIRKKSKYKYEILEKDEFKCTNCGSKENLTIDHLTKHPTQHKYRNSGAYDPKVCKCTTLCERCHLYKNKVEFNKIKNDRQKNNKNTP